MGGYGQFCPVAMAAEILTRRWTPLVVRELLCGSVRFNDIQRGVPRMSRSLLSHRLAELEQAGVLERTVTRDGHPEYRLTEAGRELEPIINQMGVWGKRWARGDFNEEHLDARLLLWDMRRNIVEEQLPGRRIVVHLSFQGATPSDREFWLCLEPEAVDVCDEDPGFGCDLELATDVRTLTQVWMGDYALGEALRRGDLRLRGPAALRRAFPGWLGLSLFAPYERMEGFRGR